MSENGTIWRSPYNPNAPVDRQHQVMELSMICVFNGLSLCLIIARTAYRWYRFRRLRVDDRWMIGAGIILVFPYWVSQIETNFYGSGLHTDTVPNAWLPGHWQWSWGWVGYYVVCGFLKVSVMCCLLEILPYPYVKLRRFLYFLCFLVLGLALAETCMWLFQCQPFLSNFVYDIDPDWCLDIDIPRYVWNAVSIPIDFVIVYVPYMILRKTLLQKHEKRVLVLVFASNLLGTLACAAGVYGTWANRSSVTDLTYYEVPFVVTNDIEIFCYTLGATFPVLSRHIIRKTAPSHHPTAESAVPSWRVPNSTYNGTTTYRTEISAGRPGKHQRWKSNELDSILDSKTWRGYGGGGSFGVTTTITTEVTLEDAIIDEPMVQTETRISRELILDDCCRDLDLESEPSRHGSLEMIRR